MDLLDKNDQLQRNQSLVKGVITDLQNRLTYAKAETVRLKAKQNSTERFCANRKDQISAGETYIETVKKQMQEKCDEAEKGLGSDAFKDYIKKLNEKFNDARVAK
jgi:predicted  nucleic acid-binding Zn-ribbon protein